MFRAWYRKRVEAYMHKCDDTTARRFAVEVHRAFAHSLLSQIVPPPDAPLDVSAMCEVLERHGFGADILMTNGVRKAAMECLQWAIARELRRANPSATYYERHKASMRIFSVLDDCFELRLRKRKP